MNPFWDERNYRPDAGKVKASVFATHCLQDDNVDPDQTTEWWHALARHNVPRKLWLCREGHIDPFMTNRAEWMRQLHALVRPLAARACRTGSWTSRGSTSRTPRTTGRSTRTGRSRAPRPSTCSCSGDTRRDGRHARRRVRRRDGHAGLDRRARPERGHGDEHRGRTTQNNRRVFLSPPLKPDLRMSGIAADASCGRRWTSRSRTSRAMLVDYGPTHPDHALRRRHSPPAARPATAGEPSRDARRPTASVMDFDACYQQPTKPTVTSARPRAGGSRGIMDSSNRESLYDEASPSRPAPSTGSASRSCPSTTRSRPATGSASC